MRGWRRQLLALGALGIGGIAWSAPARCGELLRCQGADGQWVYTDDKAVCPESEPFEPQGQVVSAEPTTRPAARTTGALPARKRAGDQLEAAEAERWRARKAAKLAELDAIEAQRNELKRFVRICNRRGRVVRYDAAGIESEVPCSQIRQRFAAFDEEEAEIREYLANGLPEECRRAGCLPGWIR